MRGVGWGSPEVREAGLVPTDVMGETSSVADERKTYGQVAYEPFVRSGPPPWKAWVALTDAQRAAWENGALAVAENVMSMVERVVREMRSGPA
jgi:hypothetical protein